MNDRYRINFSDNQVREWVYESSNLTKWQRKNYKTNIENLCECINIVTPKQMFSNITKLIIDEGVKPTDIDVYVVTESGDEHLLDLGLETIYEDVYTDPLSA